MERYTALLDWKKYTTKAIYRFSAVLIKLPMAFFTDLNKNFTTCVKTQKTGIAKAILRKRNRAEGIRLPDFRICYKATAIKTV